MYLADNGSLIATASKAGTIVRLYNTEDGKCWQEFRQGFQKILIDLLW